jgi:gamma-glutamylcyclotransferase (GGCT)/AIG2-like uncharacterized protein YtfP
MTETQLPFFVYGTLRPGERNYFLVERAVIETQPAEMAGLELWDMGPYPMAAEGTGRLRGDLLTLDPAQYEKALADMDLLEQVNPAAPTDPGGLYWRARRTVILPGCGGSPPVAWVYLADPARARQGTRITSGDWKQR